MLCEIDYKRNVYLTKDEEGHNSRVYLLNQEMNIDKMGLISTEETTREKMNEELPQ